MMSLIVWVVLGVTVGGIASLLLKTDGADQSPAANVGASLIGAVIGGALASIVGYNTGVRIEQELSFQTVLFSGVGAMLGLFAANFLWYRGHHPHHEVP